MNDKKTKKDFFNNAEQKEIVAAIQEAEKNTSGEIRVFVESNCTHSSALERAQELFFNLKMHETQLRNGVIIYLASEDHCIALFADEGIYAKTGGNEYWENEVAIAIEHFKKGAYKEGMVQLIKDIGNSLTEYFPAKEIAKNELPDDIIFGH